MRCLLAIGLMALALNAQSPLTTLFAPGAGGAAGGAVYFDLTCTHAAGITLTEFGISLQGTGGIAGSMDVYVAPIGVGHTDPGWSLASGGSYTSAVPTTPTPVTLTPPIVMADGCAFRVAIVSTLAQSYTTGTALPLVYSTAELELQAGQASNVPFTGTLFNPRIANLEIHYTLGGSMCPEFSTVETQGDGCVSEFASIYEQLTPTGMDLAGQTVTGTRVGGSAYSVTTAPGAIAASGALSAPTALALPDDGQLTAGTLGLTVGSNCWVALGSGNSNAFLARAGDHVGQPVGRHLRVDRPRPNRR